MKDSTHADVVLCVQENRLTGADFVELTSDQLKELFPVMGTRMAIQRLIAAVTPPTDKQQVPQASGSQMHVTVSYNIDSSLSFRCF